MSVFIEIECCNCGILFQVSTKFKDVLINEQRSFYCPSGHRQSYTEMSLVEKIKIKDKSIRLLKSQNIKLEREIKILNKTDDKKK